MTICINYTILLQIISHFILIELHPMGNALDYFKHIKKAFLVVLYLYIIYLPISGWHGRNRHYEI